MKKVFTLAVLIFAIALAGCSDDTYVNNPGEEIGKEITKLLPETCFGNKCPTCNIYNSYGSRIMSDKNFTIDGQFLFVQSEKVDKGTVFDLNKVKYFEYKSVDTRLVFDLYLQ